MLVRKLSHEIHDFISTITHQREDACFTLNEITYDINEMYFEISSAWKTL